MKIEKEGMTLYSKDELAGMKIYGKDKISKGENYFEAVPRWVSGDYGEQLYTIRIAQSDIEPIPTFTPYITGIFGNPPAVGAKKASSC